MRVALTLRTAFAATVVAACIGVPSVMNINACAPKKGAIMLAVETDMHAPKDVNVIAISIQVGPEIKFNFVGRVTPDGEVLLPTTLAITEPDDPTQPIKIRVIAFQDTKARVLRDVLTTVPRDGRVGLLRIPLSFVNDGSAIGALPAENLPPIVPHAATPGVIGELSPAADLHPLTDPFNPYGTDVTSVCDLDLTLIDGACASATVDSATLPDFDPSLVSRADNKCFDCGDCFSGWRPITLDPTTCTAPKGGDVTNVSFVTTSSGECTPAGNCFVPIDHTDGEGGWKDEGANIRLSPGACKKVREGAAQLGVVGGTTCDTKSAAFPVCSGPNEGPLADAGADSGDASKNPDVDAAVDATPILITGADKPSGVVGLPGDDVYYGAPGGLFRSTNRQAGALIATSPTATEGPWFVSANGADVAFANGATVATTGPTTLAYVFTAGTLNAITFNPALGAALDGVAITGAAQVFYGLFSGTNAGDVYSSAFTGFAGQSGTTIGDVKSVSFTQNTNTLWAGSHTGEVVSCGTVATLNCQPGITVDATAPDQNVEAIATLASDNTKVFALMKTGVYFITPPSTVKKYVSDALSGITDATFYYPRGMASIGACAFFASEQGVDAITSDGLTRKNIANMGGKSVIGVFGQPNPKQTDQFIYFSVYATAANGGGIYRVQVPALCL